MADKLIINKRELRGDDGYKVFSVRLKDDTVNSLDLLSDQSNRSRNELINTLLDYAIGNCEIK
ncbi:MAG: ribbon-helix-helix protein, CopG family [Oscillospiraceae bacterium]|nr:ribbon-helix-helix protein, CopG family [Oscillospiraceae bacterium]